MEPQRLYEVWAELLPTIWRCQELRNDLIEQGWAPGDAEAAAVAEFRAQTSGRGRG